MHDHIPRLIIRITALFLAPCLLADSAVSASCEVVSPAVLEAKSSVLDLEPGGSVFNEQALAAVGAWQRLSRLLSHRTFTYRTPPPIVDMAFVPLAFGGVRQLIENENEARMEKDRLWKVAAEKVAD